MLQLMIAQAPPTGMNWEPWNLVTQVGLSVALVIFFVLRDSQRQKADAVENSTRETRLNARIESLETFHREVLLQMNAKSTECLTHSSTAIDQCTKAIENNTRVLERIGTK
jgi:hypothetical protein